jgi:hypothetical protein
VTSSTLSRALEQLDAFRPSEPADGHPGQDAERLRRLTADLARHLPASAQEELRKRLTHFAGLTGNDSDLVKCVKNAAKALEAANKTWSDVLVIFEGDVPVEVCRSRPDRTPRTVQEYLSGLAVNAANLPEVTATLRDMADHLDGAAEQRGRAAGVLRPLVEALARVQAAAETDHVHGCLLIQDCGASVDAQWITDGRRDLLNSRLAASTAAAAIRDAAHSLGITGRPSRPRTQAGVIHPPDEQPEPRYCYGPLEGNLTELGSATSPGKRKRPDGRPLKDKVKTGNIWVRGHGQRFQVFFQTEREFTAAKTRLEEFRLEHPRKPRQPRRRKPPKQA